MSRRRDKWRPGRFIDLDAEDRRTQEFVEREERIQSSHVIMVPWCQCCEARVEIDHICECER